MTNRLPRVRQPVTATFVALALTLAGTAAPLFAQDTLAEGRLRKMEAEIRALQRQVFPGGDGKFFAPEVPAAGSTTTPATSSGTPATTPVTDLLSRMDAVETQLARLTAQMEENSNRLGKLEARLAPAPAATGDAAPAAATTATAPATAPANLVPASTAPAASATAPATRPAATTAAAAAPRATATPAPRTSATPAGPSAQRLAAVRAIVKPQTDDAGDDEYSYGFRLWEAKFFPEAQQQLKLMVDRYPRHQRISFARNLLGRAYLDDGKPRDAATWFLQNYQADKRGARAADSLLLLAESMRQLKDTSRACIALAEFGETYAVEAAGRLRSQYDATRNAVKCN